MSKSRKSCDCALVVLSRDYAKVWDSGMGSSIHSTTIYEPRVGHGYARSANKFLNGWSRHSLDPVFAEKIYERVVGLEKISLVGAGRGHTKTLRHFVRYVTDTHPEIAGHLEVISSRNAEKIVKKELLAIIASECDCRKL